VQRVGERVYARALFNGAAGTKVLGTGSQMLFEPSQSRTARG
jgi:galactokinase/mevalonate kinase-like predicted kinase